MMIRIVRRPDGEGYHLRRDCFVGCEVTVEQPDPVPRSHTEFDDDGVALFYRVGFSALVESLRCAGHTEWADYYAALSQPPSFVYFPVDCAETIEE